MLYVAFGNVNCICTTPRRQNQRCSIISPGSVVLTSNQWVEYFQLMLLDIGKNSACFFPFRHYLLSFSFSTWPTTSNTSHQMPERKSFKCQSLIQSFLDWVLRVRFAQAITSTSLYFMSWESSKPRQTTIKVPLSKNKSLIIASFCVHKANYWEEVLPLDV